MLNYTYTIYPKKYAHSFCFAELCCGYTLTDFPISTRFTSLALWQSNNCPSASKATPMNMDKYFMWIQYEQLHNHNKAKHNKTVCIFLGIHCTQFLDFLGLNSRVQQINSTLQLHTECQSPVFGAKNDNIGIIECVQLSNFLGLILIYRLYIYINIHIYLYIYIYDHDARRPNRRYAVYDYKI